MCKIIKIGNKYKISERGEDKMLQNVLVAVATAAATAAVTTIAKEIIEEKR